MTNRSSPGEPCGVPDGYEVRLLQRDDYQKGFKELLAQLSDVGDLSEECFLKVFDSRSQQVNSYRCVVVEHVESKCLVSTATLLVEEKFLHGGARVGHIEDVVTDSSHQRRGLARLVMSTLASHTGERPRMLQDYPGL
eukprot:CAMPEP_0169420238 /NCGR_PEP_ID=MMETSP1017-20121227/65426_1 /TAXON_ID=342587 /ORGANISM="Karlodinium micrum, Strain CCMP2283" /LENGTH=137 /DNA_ID=CAMNT_0009528993 /DNA_START=64 /DNA_END=477 /DNA_ORIENTATION=+